ADGRAARCGPGPAPRKSDHGSLAIGGLPFPRRLVSTHSRSLFGPSTRRGAGRAGPGGRTRAPPPWPGPPPSAGERAPVENGGPQPPVVRAVHVAVARAEVVGDDVTAAEGPGGHRGGPPQPGLAAPAPRQR